MRHSFWAHKYRSKMQQKLVQQETGAFGNNIGKESQKPRPQMKNMCIIYLLIIFAVSAIQCKC